MTAMPPVVATHADNAPMVYQRWIAHGPRRYHFRVAGTITADETPLVLVHGLGVSGAYWGRIQPQLAHARPVYAPDLPGFGLTTKPRGLLDINGLAGALADWLEAMGLPRVHLVGHSMGGQVVAEYTRAHPDAVSRAVLVGSTIGTAGPRAPGQAMGLLRDSLHERGALLRIILRDYFRAGPRRILGTDTRADDHDTIASIAQIAAPLLIVRGSRDSVVSRHDAMKMVHIAPDARYREIRDGPHAVQWSKPHVLAAMIEAFLDPQAEPGQSADFADC